MIGLNPEREKLMNLLQPPLAGLNTSIGSVPFWRTIPQASNRSSLEHPGNQAKEFAERLGAHFSDRFAMPRTHAPQLDFPANFGDSRSAQLRFEGKETRLEPPPNPFSSLRLDARSLQQRSQTLELALKTRDGDVVTLRLEELTSMDIRQQVSMQPEGQGDSTVTSGQWQGNSSTVQMEYLNAQLSRDGTQDVRYAQAWSGEENTAAAVQSDGAGGKVQVTVESQQFRAGSLQFAVEGNLDAQELEAIRELVAGVQALSETFFEGDLMRAFGQARELGYDAGEIAGYSLELRDQQLSVEAQRYRAADALREPMRPRGLFRAIGNYTAKLKSLHELDQRVWNGQLFEQLMQEIDTWRSEDAGGRTKKNSFADFNRELLALTEALGMHV